MRISLTILALVALLAGGVPRIVRAGDSAAAPAAGPGGGGPNDWPATVPSFATNTEDWSKLTRELLEHNMPYGALAAAYRMLMFFSDLNLKEQAYRTIVQIIDMGYAFPTKSFFVTGDIEPKEDYDFSNSYYFYKAMAALDKGVRKWADSYLATVDTANFPKYLFYQAIDAYQRQEYDKSEKLLLKILAAKPGDKYASLVRKVARTLARIYFERQQYAQAYDVYRTFLLRMNPIEPGDWLEAAWNLYYLQRYEEALGMVFNLESLPTGEMVNLEKYVLRALIYEEVCATEYMEKLVTTFEK
jgi:tetratricopeptide (TPR) repeat protein